MSTALYLAPTTDAVHAHIVDHVRSVHREHPLAPMTFLLPSGDAIRQLRKVLGNVIGVRFLQFHNLGAAILSEAGSATHEMSDLATRRLIRGILGARDRRGQLTTFVVMLDKPGFIDRAEWLDGRMEQAESSRLLYVACTRAADLLILSGIPKKDSWLEILARAWELDLSEQRVGERTANREELFERAGYRIRVEWPVCPDEEQVRTGEPGAHATAPPALLAVTPALAEPLPPRPATWPVAVTHLPEDDGSEDELARLRPIVQVGEAGLRGSRPWRYLVGNLTHRALAHWDCLVVPDEALQEMLVRWARRGGLFEPDDIARAVGRVARMLDGLRSTALYGQVCGARERHGEVPLSICAGQHRSCTASSICSTATRQASGASWTGRPSRFSRGRRFPRPRAPTSARWPSTAGPSSKSSGTRGDLLPLQPCRVVQSVS